MKKLVNAYGIELEARLLDLDGQPQTFRQLALWTIVSIRWPPLAEYLAQHPEEVVNVGDPTGGGADLPQALEPVFRSTRVRYVITGGNVHPPVALDRPAIEAFIGAVTVGVTPSSRSASSKA